MLYEFLKTNRMELIVRCRAKAARRSQPGTTPAVVEFGIPQFLAQLIETFRVERTPEALARQKAAGHGRPSLALVPAEIPSTAAKHGDELRRQGVTIDEVVHGYGDLCQALTELALELDAPISVDEFHTFNRCLDDAIADAVTAYSRPREKAAPGTAAGAVNVRHASPLEEMRNLLETASLSFAAIKGGYVGLEGATAAVLQSNLVGLRDLLDHFMADGAENAQAPAVQKRPSP